MLFGAKGEGIDVDASIGGTGVCLEGLDLVEVGSLALGEAVLTIKLKLGDHNGVKTPAVHVKGGLGKDERGGIRDGISSRSSSSTLGYVGGNDTI